MIIERGSRSSNSNPSAARKYGARLWARCDLVVNVVVAAGAIFLLGSLAGCGGGDNGSVTRGSPTNLTTTSVVAVDCKRQRAYVPLPDLNADLHGQVAVLDLSVDPDQQNPLVKIIDIGLIALPRSAAVDFKSGTVLVLVDNVLGTGRMLLIDESDYSLTSVLFPVGSRPAETSGVVVDSKSGTALVSMSDSLTDCTEGFGGCTGQATFDLATRSFGPLIVTLFDIDSFALNPSSAISLDSSDPISPQLLGLNLPGAETCFLDDSNVETLDADPDGMAVDPTTNIWVAGNFESPIASVINLHRATIEGSGNLNCILKEGGTPPNSVNHDTGTGAPGMPGVAINPLTHQAFMTAQGGNQIALLFLPTSKMKQLTDNRVSSVNATIPNDPNGNVFSPANFPYATNVDSCRNLGYVADDDYTFLAQINLHRFRINPSSLSTSLPVGSCAGLSTSFKCDNGRGVKFFPIGTTSGSAARVTLPQFSTGAFKAHKSAKQRGIPRYYQ